MQKVNWWVVGITSVVIVLLLFGGGMMMGGWGMMGGMGYGRWGMMNGYGMMGNWGYSPFGWVGMLFMGLSFIATIVLIVFGVAWLVQKIGKSTPPSS